MPGGPPISAEDVKLTLANDYGIEELKSFRKITKGLGNDLYVIKTEKGMYTLKIAVRNNSERIHYEVDLLNHLRGLPTPRLVQTKEGKYLFRYKDHWGLIYPYLPGEEKEMFTDRMLREVGEALGKLHLQTQHFTSDVERTEFYNLSPQQVDEMLKIIGKTISNPKIQKAIPQLTRTLGFGPPKTQQGAIHIDLKPENVLFTDEELTGIVDFDNSYIGPLVLDLANTVMWFSSKEGEFDTSAAKTIFDGYASQRELPASEKESFCDTLHYAFLSHMVIDIYYLALGLLPEDYILWGIDNLLKTEQNLALRTNELKELLEV
jgi:homoserine kinase type II